MKNLLGYGLGSACTKASLLDITTGHCIAATSPGSKMEMAGPRPAAPCRALQINRSLV